MLRETVPMSLYQPIHVCSEKQALCHTTRQYTCACRDRPCVTLPGNKRVLRETCPVSICQPIYVCLERHALCHSTIRYTCSYRDRPCVKLLANTRVVRETGPMSLYQSVYVLRVTCDVVAGDVNNDSYDMFCSEILIK